MGGLLGGGGGGGGQRVCRPPLSNYLGLLPPPPSPLPTPMAMEFSRYSAKASLIFSAKNFSVFGYKVVKHLTS